MITHRCHPIPAEHDSIGMRVGDASKLSLTFAFLYQVAGSRLKDEIHPNHVCTESGHLVVIS